MNIKVIKTDQDYREALKQIEVLMDSNPNPESADGERLSILTVLVRDYESTVYPQTPADPIDAIKFRMEQLNLRQADLVQYLGSRSKVSEILSRKRALSVDMMRALQKGLGIPAKVLLNEPELHNEDENDVKLEWSKFPVKEMEERDYFIDQVGRNLEEKIQSFISSISPSSQLFALMKKTYYIRSPRPMNKYALLAWSKRVIDKAGKVGVSIDYVKGTVTPEFMMNMARLSVENNSVLLAIEKLKEVGIALVIEPHLQKTYLDGAVIMDDKKRPVIGLTLRSDRLDGFWFNLMHELAHISLHFDKDITTFFDEIKLDDYKNENPDSQLEREADNLAREVLVPKSMWDKSLAKILSTEETAYKLAKDLGVHVSIVAGKMRFEKKQYRYLNSLVGYDEVRKFFPEIKW